MNTPHRELYDNYQLEEQREIFEAMSKESEVHRQYVAVQQVLQARTQELRILIGRFKQFNSRTSVEEVMEAQRQAEALRWLITCIERELRELEELCSQYRVVERYSRTAVLLPA